MEQKLSNIAANFKSEDILNKTQKIYQAVIL